MLSLSYRKTDEERGKERRGERERRGGRGVQSNLRGMRGKGQNIQKEEKSE